MRGKTIAILPLLLTLLLSGCQKNFLPIRYEIDQVDVVRIVGVDQAQDDPSLVEVTFMSKDIRKTSTESSQGTQVVSTVSSVGSTVFDAKRKLKSHSDKVTLLSHADFIIIGEAAARDDFTKYLDCFTRDQEFRFTPKVYIARGCTAKEMMQTSSTGDMFLGDRLKNLQFDARLMGSSKQMQLIEVAAMLDNRTSATIIPAIVCREIKDEVFTGEMPKNDVISSGYAIIKDFKLAGFFDASISRGYNFLNGDIATTNMTVLDNVGMKVELVITSEQVSVEAAFDGDAISRVTYVVFVKSTIREQQSRENIYTPDALTALERQLCDIIGNEMRQVIDQAKEMNTDAIGLGQKIRLSHPLHWDKLKSSWSETFPNLDIQVEVTAQIRRTLSIEEPNGYQKES